MANTSAASTNVRTELLVAMRFASYKQRYVLVRPGYAQGKHGASSVWVGELDRKLYVQKTLTHSVHDRLTKPKDILHYVAHDNVPKLIDSTKHPVGAKPADKPRGKIEENLWSSVSEFINGPSLDMVIEDYQRQNRVIPKATIWQVGVKLLTVVLEMCYPSALGGRSPLLHKDIRDRNVVVRQTPGSDDTDVFLIDFGRSNLVAQHQGTYRDLSMISELLLGLMLRENITDNNPYQRLVQRAEEASQLRGWPYSKELLQATKWLYALDRATTKVPPKDQVVARLNDFKARAESAKTTGTQKGQAVAISATPRIPSGLVRPISFTDENDDRYQKLLKQSSQACPTLEKIWIRAGSVNNWLQGQPLDVIRRDNNPVLADWVADICWG